MPFGKAVHVPQLGDRHKPVRRARDKKQNTERIVAETCKAQIASSCGQSGTARRLPKTLTRDPIQAAPVNQYNGYFLRPPVHDETPAGQPHDRRNYRQEKHVRLQHADDAMSPSVLLFVQGIYSRGCALWCASLFRTHFSAGSTPCSRRRTTVSIDGTPGRENGPCQRLGPASPTDYADRDVLIDDVCFVWVHSRPSWRDVDAAVRAGRRQELARRRMRESAGRPFNRPWLPILSLWSRRPCVKQR